MGEGKGWGRWGEVTPMSHQSIISLLGTLDLKFFLLTYVIDKIR